VLADEINRTPPKTQSALLQSMQEYQVTGGGQTYPLDLPFFVLATQNPIEQEGTYPLPEAQLDRFMFMINVDYPEREHEYRIVETTTGYRMPEASPILTGEDLLRFQRIVREVPVPRPVLEYAVHLTRATRPGDETATDMAKQFVKWGAGPRSSQYLILGGRARALTQGRYNVSFADVRAVLPPVMRHRIMTNFNAQAEDVSADDIIRDLVERVDEPGE
jgi:MoxR-like ATPase